jgi:hypothetical protein
MFMNNSAGKSGKDMIPHTAMWTSLAGLVGDGLAFTMGHQPATTAAAAPLLAGEVHSQPSAPQHLSIQPDPLWREQSALAPGVAWLACLPPYGLPACLPACLQISQPAASPHSQPACGGGAPTAAHTHRGILLERGPLPRACPCPVRHSAVCGSGAAGSRHVSSTRPHTHPSPALM